MASWDEAAVTGRLRQIAQSAGRKVLQASARLAMERNKYCCICQRKVSNFIPYRGGLRSVSARLRMLQVVGSDVENYECPFCGASDRERHLSLYMNKADYRAKLCGRRVLHFAPEHTIKTLVESWQPAQYICADLHPRAPDVLPADITTLPFADGAFDCVIANHVLEHVSNDGAALAEVARVLAPGGLAILQTPFALGLSGKLEDASLVSEEQRLHAYGQEDHVRLYGNDFVMYVSSHSGLEAAGASHAELLPDIDAWEYGVNNAEPFLAFRKMAFNSRRK